MRGKTMSVSGLWLAGALALALAGCTGGKEMDALKADVARAEASAAAAQQAAEAAAARAAAAEQRAIAAEAKAEEANEKAERVFRASLNK